MGAAIALYLAIGSVVGLVFIIWLYMLDKKLENTPVEDDEEYMGRIRLSQAWDDIEGITNSTAMAAVFVFATSVLLWPIMVISWVKTIILGR